MSAIAIFSVLTGAVLGQRFKVLVLIPAIVAFWAVIAVGALALGWSFAEVVTTMLLVAGGLQLGYLAGLILRGLLGGLRMRARHINRPAPASSRTGLPAL